MNKWECQNCESEFEEPVYIEEDDPRCPYCMSGDIIGGDEENE